jgi:probable HAF family extracellular repeat protein
MELKEDVMKKNLSRYIIVLSLFAALAVPVQLAAQDKQSQTPTSQVHPQQYHHYQLVDIGTLGGPSSSNAWSGFNNKTMNSTGAVLGEANTSYTADLYCLYYLWACFMADAFEWHNGVLTDLTGLPGNVNGTYGASINSRGWVTGLSGNGAIDPLTGYPQMHAVVWKQGKGTDLGTLGGNGSAAFGINDRGQIVGGALNDVPDNFSTGFPAPNCGGPPCIDESYPAFFFPSATQVHAVLWQNGTMKDLGTLGGPDSFAWQINARGEIAGQSYLDSVPNASTGVPTTHPFFIGDDGKMVDVGSLGGTASWVGGLNNRGQVIGAMTLAGDGGWHPFLWSHGVLTDLGTLGADCGMATSINDVGDIVGIACTPTLFSAVLWRDSVLIDLGTVGADRCAEAYSINSHGQVVGESGDCGGPLPNHGWVWQNSGPVVNLNSLIVPSSLIRFGHAVFINDRGEISGDGYLPNGDVHAIVLIPCDENHPDVEGCDYNEVEVTTEAPVRSAPTATSTAKPSAAEMMMRYRSLVANRYRRFGALPLK